MKDKNSTPLNLLFFDLETRGHHLDYIRHIIIFKQREAISGCIFIVVAPQFVDKFKLYISDFSALEAENIYIVPILMEEFAYVKQATSLAAKTIKIWRIAKKYAEDLAVDHCVFMWLDHILQLPLALHWKFPCSISGICFRPMFHYLDLSNLTLSRLDKLKAWRQKILYYSAIRHPQLHILYCLDPFVPNTINKLSHRKKAVHLPDPVFPRHTTSLIEDKTMDNLKQLLNIKKQRKVFLFFGAIAARKGIYKLLEALTLLEKATSENVTLLLVGEIVHIKDNLPIHQMIDIVKMRSSVQMVFLHKFVSETDMANYFALADVILAPYQKHVGMSGILLQAAASGKPVISSNYGLMGQVIRQHSLGLAVDTEHPEAIALAIKETFSESFTKLYSREKMSMWVKQNSPENFSKTIFDHIKYTNA